MHCIIVRFVILFLYTYLYNNKKKKISLYTETFLLSLYDEKGGYVYNTISLLKINYPFFSITSVDGKKETSKFYWL